MFRYANQDPSTDHNVVVNLLGPTAGLFLNPVMHSLLSRLMSKNAIQQDSDLLHGD
jgi:hypothetical protein